MVSKWHSRVAWYLLFSDACPLVEVLMSSKHMPSGLGRVSVEAGVIHRKNMMEGLAAL